MNSAAIDTVWRSDMVIHDADDKGHIIQIVHRHNNKKKCLPISPLMDRDQAGAMTRSQVPCIYTHMQNSAPAAPYLTLMACMRVVIINA